MKPAVVESVIGGDGDADVFARARRAGFAGVEIELRRSQLRDPRRERLAGLRRVVDGTGLGIPSLVLGEHNDGGIADADPAVAAAAEEDVRAAAVWAAELGVDAILVPFFLRGELVTAGDADRCAEAFRRVCPAAAERGVTLCFEGTLPAVGVRQLAERIASPAFGCYFDLANPIVDGLDPPTELRALADLVRRVHMKDTLVRRGDCAPGLGRVDFDQSARALEEIAYDGWLTLETPPGPPEVVARDVAFAHSMFDRLEPVFDSPRFGAFSYGFREWPRLAETFPRLGLEAVQLGTELLEDALDDPARAGSHGLSVAALAGYRNLIAPDPEVRRANLAFIGRCLELAPRLGTSIVATEAGTRNADNEWADVPENRGEEAWRLFLDAVETLLPVAERHGSVLALEATVKHVLRTQSRLIELLDAFPSRHLQLVCDPYNLLSSHLLPAQQHAMREFLDRFEHRFVVAHLKDVGPGGAEESTPELGTGVFDQRPYLEFLRTRRRDLPLILEHLPLEHVPRAIGRVREILTEAPA
jgi:sugar phosphate isomerase/epimerase